MTRDRIDSKLSEHTRYKKELKPPFLRYTKMTSSSWIDERLPEMLWAVLVIGNVEREKALSFFRYIGDYIHNNPDCYNVTLSGIGKYPKAKRKGFIVRASSWSDEVKTALRPLILFPGIPAVDDWKDSLGEPIPKDDWRKLSDAVLKSSWHQSQEATDCRWIRLFCVILGGKMKFPRGMEDTVRGVFEFPNYGDMRRIRPFIRASEISLTHTSKEEPAEWSQNFWSFCFDETGCIPEEAVNEKIKNRQKELSDEMEVTGKYYLKETVEVRNKLIDQFFDTSKASAIDSRHEGAFGIALYGLTLFIEIILYRVPLSITGRLAFRSLVEAYITFKYLLQKEKEAPRIWDDYRIYGTGQLKLLYLKLKELNKEISSIEIDNLDYLANEDKWIEFIPINLGHWASIDLRKMSKLVGLKELYDKYYVYTSGYMHSTWGAVRESVYQKCVNPLHRLHIVPTYDLPLMPSVTSDARDITNGILECLSEAYPKFDCRLMQLDKNEQEKSGS